MQKLAVFGGTGIIGRSIIEYLDTQDDWQGIGVARHKQQISELTPFVELDLLQPELSDAAKAQFADVTHAVYAAYVSHEDKFKENELNIQMFQGAMQVLKTAAPNLKRVVLMQGVKAYGVHLGPFKTPAKETDPRHLPPNFYYDQEDILKETAKQQGWEVTILRPDVLCGFSIGTPMSIVLVIAVYLAEAVGQILATARYVYRDYQAEKSSRQEIAPCRKQLESQLQAVLDNPPVKGWPADAQRLANRIKRHWQEWFTFLDHPEVKPDNNDAERALRPVVVHREVTGGARSDWGAKLVGCLTSDTAGSPNDGNNLLIDWLQLHDFQFSKSVLIDTVKKERGDALSESLREFSASPRLPERGLPYQRGEVGSTSGLSSRERRNWITSVWSCILKPASASTQ